MRRQLSGFSQVFLLLMLVAASLVGLVGWYVLQTEINNNGKQPEKKSPQTFTYPNSLGYAFTLLDSRIALTSDRIWKTATGGYYS